MANEGEALAVKLGNLETMALPPKDAAEREQIGKELYTGLCLNYERIAPERDVYLIKTAAANCTDPEFLAASKRFDEYILEQFAEWGWRMLMSRDIIAILARWEALAPELFRRL